MASIPRRQRKRLSQAQRRRLKRRQAKKARKARRRLRQLHDRLPRPARYLFDAFAAAFTRPAFLRFVVLLPLAILALGGRTIAKLLRSLGALVPGHFTSFNRLLSRCRWQGWRLARALATLVLDRFVAQGP